MLAEFPVTGTTPEDTRILHFLVMRKLKKRVTIVARDISEERDERSARHVGLDSNQMIDPPGWKGDMGAPNAASGAMSNAQTFESSTAWKCLRVNGDGKRRFPISSGTRHQ